MITSSLPTQFTKYIMPRSTSATALYSFFMVTPTKLQVELSFE